MSLRFGIDLGGTKIEIVALAEDGSELLRQRIATPQGDYQATVAAIALLVEQVEDELGLRGSVGVGIPGAESRRSGLIKNANSTCLNGRPLRRDLQALLQREVRLANDANCFALSEAVDGAGQGAAVVFGAILGTGVGGGIVSAGKALTGVNGIAGEWGHNPMPALPGMGLWPLREKVGHPPGPLPEEGGDGISSLREPVCYCGRSGCIETFLSGPGMTADHARINGAVMSPQEINDCASQGDRACEATLQRYEARLARAISQVINLLDPDVIVLGGGLSNLDRLYVNVPRLWGEHIFSDHVATRLEKPRHGDSSGVRGAAWLWESSGV